MTIDGAVNKTIVTSGTLYGSTDPLMLRVQASDGVVRCGSVLQAQFYGMTTVATFTLSQPPFSFFFIDVLGASVTLMFLWCGPGVTYATHDVIALQTGVVPETHARIVAGTCPVSMLNSGDFYGFIMIVNGDDHACGMHMDGRVYCWGMNDHCQLGVGLPTGTPIGRGVLYPHFSDFIWITANKGVTCGLRYGGDVVCWGMFRGDPSPNQQCETNGFSRYGFGLGLTASSGLAIGITSNGLAVTNENRIYLVDFSNEITQPTSDWTLFADYSVTLNRGGAYWSQYAVWASDLTKQGITNGFVAHGDTAFGIVDLRYGFIGWLGPDAPCGGLEQTSPLSSGCMLALSMTVPSAMIGSYVINGRFTMYGGIVYATKVRIFGPVRTGSYGFYYNTFYGQQMGVGDFYDANTGQMNDGLPRGGFTCLGGGVCSIGMFNFSSFSRGRGHFCLSNGTWVCRGDNVDGQLDYRLAIVSGIVGISAFQLAAGGDTTCYIVTPGYRVRCIGAYGTGVVRFVGSDVYSGYVEGSVVVGQPVSVQANVVGGWMQSAIVGVGGMSVQINARGGCFVEYQVACNNTVYNFSASAGPRRYAMTCGNVPMCVELQTCVTNDWAVRGSAVSTGVVVGVSVGDTYTCRLLLSGTVECVGEVTDCGYILPLWNVYDMLEFNAVYTGNIGPIGQLASTGSTTCYIAQDGHAIACSGSTQSYHWCVPQSMFVAYASSGMIIEDMWVGSQGVCYSEAVVPVTALTSVRRVWCAGVSTSNNLLGYSGELVNGVMQPTPVGRFALRLMQNVSYMPLSFRGRVRMLLDMDGTAGVGPCVVVADARCMPIVFGTSLRVNATMFCVNGVVTSASGIAKSISARYNATSFYTFDGQRYDGQVVSASSSYGNVSCVVLVDGYAACIGAWQQKTVQTWDRMAGVWGNRYGRLWKIGDGSISRVATGLRHLVLLTTDNVMYCIGDNGFGQCGHVYTNVSSDGVAVAMSPELSTWPYVASVMMLTDVTTMPTVYDVSLSEFATSTLLFVGVVCILCALVISIGCSYAVHHRFVWSVKKR